MLKDGRLTGRCSWWVAWACGSQGGYGYCVAFALLGTLAVGQAPRALALGALGEAVRARALQAQPAHADQAPRRRHGSTPPPPELHASPLGSPRTSLTRLPALPYPCSGPSAKASLPLSVAAPSQRSASQCTVALLAEVPFQAAKKSDRPDARACDRCANSVAGWPLPAARGQ